MVFDAVTDVKLLEGVTDAAGQFRFPVPREAIRSGHGLRVLVDAGEGHRNDWTVEASEFRPASSAAGARPDVKTPRAPVPRPALPAAQAGPPPSAGNVATHADNWATPQDMERIVNASLDARLAPAEARDQAVRTLEELGLSDFTDRLTHRLSGGEKKLVSLAAVLAMRPEALLLDEPTNGLDPAARDRIAAVLRDLPTARLVISHDWEFLAGISSTYLTIQNQRLVCGAPAASHAHVHAHPLGDAPHVHEG